MRGQKTAFPDVKIVRSMYLMCKETKNQLHTRYHQSLTGDRVEKGSSLSDSRLLDSSAGRGLGVKDARVGRASAKSQAAGKTAQRAAKRPGGRHTVRRRGPSTASLIGGVMTILAVGAILSYAVLRSSGTGSTQGVALADPNAFGPRGSLLSEGQRAPDFTLTNVGGRTYHLAAQQGHPVLLEFFAVWCPVCQGEAPIMARLTQDYQHRGVRIWAVLANAYGKNYDSSGQTDLSLATKADLAWYAKKFKVQHPQLVDPKFKVVNEYGVNAYPGLYVVDSKGVIRYSASGHRSYASLAQALNRTLQGGIR
jgi:peroxiredoxin